VTQYLPETAAEDIFAYAGTLPAGSRLVFTYMPNSVINSARHVRRARRLQWQTGFDPQLLGQHLAAQGLTLRPVSPVTPRVRAMSRARHARPGVERNTVRTAGRLPCRPEAASACARVP
jgi:hypothetical protein